MKQLLKVDFKRVFKDKLLLVMGIVAVAFAVMLPLLYMALFSGTSGQEKEMLAAMMTAKSQFFGSFSIGINLGVVGPVLLAIVLCKDFSFGTIRNKIIAGKSRSAIYFSLFVTCAVVLIATVLLYALITLGVSLLFFSYQSTPFVLEDFWYFLASLGFELLVLLWVAALLSCLCANMKNVGLVIVLYFAVSLSLSLVGGGIMTVIQVMEATGNDGTWLEVLRFINRINVGAAANYIGMGTEYTLKDVMYLTIPVVAGILGFTGVGMWRFCKKDLK